MKVFVMLWISLLLSAVCQESIPQKDEAFVPFIQNDNNQSREDLEKEGFFVITAIFNPASFQSRYTLYHEFSEHMKKTGAQLITIECIFPSLNQHEFKVTDSKNPNHIQLKSESIYWMKENLINIAVSRLPLNAKYVCWLDADIIFEEEDWIGQTIKELRKYTVVQVFKIAKFLGPRPQEEVLRTDYSFGYSVVHGKPIDQKRYAEWYPHPGFGWAMDIKAFRSIGGMPDYDIVGSGDLHFAFSLLNRISNAVEESLNPEFKKLIHFRSEQTFKELQHISSLMNKSIVGYVPLSISHCWHGSRKDRQYQVRRKILTDHQFNYVTDWKINSDGLLQWTDSKITPRDPSVKNSFQQDMLTHFKMRKEDETESSEQDHHVTIKNTVIFSNVNNEANGRPLFVNDDDDGSQRNVNRLHQSYQAVSVCPYGNYYKDSGNNTRSCP